MLSTEESSTQEKTGIFSALSKRRTASLLHRCDGSGESRVPDVVRREEQPCSPELRAEPPDRIVNGNPSAVGDFRKPVPIVVADGRTFVGTVDKEEIDLLLYCERGRGGRHTERADDRFRFRLPYRCEKSGKRVDTAPLPAVLRRTFMVIDGEHWDTLPSE